MLHRQTALLKHLLATSLVAGWLLGGACSRNEVPAPSTDSKVETAVFSVKGMTCDGCVRAITAAVSKLDGVREVSVSLEEKEAAVTYAPAEADPSHISAVIEKLGYEVAAR